jgi:predicted ribosomally synthesized peptide with SipW-like signal peptide
VAILSAIKRPGKRTPKLVLSIAAIGVAAAMAGMGTFATFTSTTTASQQVTSGTVVIALGATGAATNRLTVAANGLVPGDTVQRAFDLSNTGNQALSSIAATTAASPSTLLDTDATNGLQMVVDRCSAAWTETGTSAPFTYTCSGTLLTVVASRAVIGSSVPMAGLSVLSSGAVDHLRATLTLPSTAGNTFQGLSSTISYSFLGTQRTATNQ